MTLYVLRPRHRWQHSDNVERAEGLGHVGDQGYLGRSHSPMSCDNRNGLCTVGTFIIANDVPTVKVTTAIELITL